MWTWGEGGQAKLDVHIWLKFDKGSSIKDVRNYGGRGVKGKKTRADIGGGGVKQGWTSTKKI